MTPQSAVLSVIIPTLNEAQNLPLLLDDLKSQRGVTLDVIVVDGGSTDQTRHLIPDSVVLIESTERNRAKQLNLGAGVARAEWFFFVHADSRIRDPDQLRRALAQLAVLPRHAGHFSLHFVGEGQERQGFRYLEAKSSLNRPNTTNGDQGFLVPRLLFEELGGFDESLPFLEDQRFAEKLRKHATWVTLDGVVETSTRRFETEGFQARYTLMAIVMGAHTAGLHGFFEAARPYVTHDESTPLDLRPFLSVVREVTECLSPQDAISLWFRVGRFVRENAWQIALMIDVYGLKNNQHTLDFFDDAIAPKLDSVAVDALTGVLTAVVIRGLLPAFLNARSSM